MDIFKIILFAFLAGICKAIRDTVAHHWEISIFAGIKSKVIRNWFQSDYKNKPRHVIWFLWDAWHFSDTLSYVAFIPIILLADQWHEIAIVLCAFYLAFNLFYSEILISKDAKMILKNDEYFPSLKKIFAFKTKQCHKCQNYFQRERIWRAETLPILKTEPKEIYTVYYLCLGCAKTQTQAVRYFLELTEREAEKLA